MYTKISAVFYSSVFGHQIPGSGLDQDLDPDSEMNPGPQLCFAGSDQIRIRTLKLVVLSPMILIIMYRRPTLYPLEIAVDFLKSP